MLLPQGPGAITAGSHGWGGADLHATYTGLSLSRGTLLHVTDTGLSLSRGTRPSCYRHWFKFE